MFLFTDIEGSTRRWASDAASMRAALIAHDEVLRTAIEAHDGFLFSHTGDGVVAAFASRRSAVDAAVAAQRAPPRATRYGYEGSVTGISPSWRIRHHPPFQTILRHVK
jgi:class 3 adenylate cyclase